MDNKQAKKLGNFLRRRREAKVLSARQLADICGLPHTTIIRFEHGAYSAPSPDKLARIAEALDLSLADVYALAEYAIPRDLPSPSLYLRTKFRDLPAAELTSVSRDVEAVLRRHGIEAKTGPRDGEDEKPDGARSSRKSTSKKGGTR